MAAEDCKAAIEGALGRPISDDEMEAIATEFQARMKAKLDTGVSKGAAVRQASEEMSDEAAYAAAKAKWWAHNNIVKTTALRAGGNDIRAETSVLSGLSSSDKANAATSVELRHKVLTAELLYPAQAKINKMGLRALALSRDPAWELRLATELYRRDDPAAAADTHDEHAKALARIFGDVLDGSRAQQNREGAFIRKREGYMGRQNWDMMKIRNVSFDKFKETFGANRAKDFEGLAPEQVNSLLHAQYEALRTGIFDNRAATTTEGAFNLASKVSQERTINFDTPEAWVKANQLYGKGGIGEAIYAQAARGARNTALMERFGSTPKKTFMEWHNENVRAATRAGDDGFVTQQRQRLNVDLFNQISGLYDSPGSHRLATIAADVRSLSQLKNLGNLVAGGQALVHVPLNALMLRQNGVPFLEAMAHQMRAIFPPTAEGREIASAAHAGLDGMFHGIIRQFYTEDGSPGQKIAGAVNAFYKWNGFMPLMDNERAGAAVGLTHNLGYNATKEFADLNPRLQVSLRRYGIEAPEWDVGRAAVQTAADDRPHVIPADIEDAKVRAKFQNYVTGEVAQGANEPTAWARNVAVAGTQSGTIAGELLRTLTQFKSFAITMAQRQWGSLARGGTLDVPGTLLLASATMAAGFLGMEMSGIVKNQYTKLPTDMPGAVELGFQSMVRGGTMGLLADAFMRDGVRSAGDVAKAAAGPVFEPVLDAIAAINNVRQGPQSASGRTSRTQEAIEGLHQVLGDLTPNFWAVQAAYNYLAPYMIANMIHPGAVQRHERAMQRNGQSWIIPPP